MIFLELHIYMSELRMENPAARLNA